MIEEASQFVLVIVWALILAYFLGGYLTRLITGRPRMFETFLSRVERPVFRIMGIDPPRSMTWNEYLLALLSMHALVGVFSFVVLLAQGVLPLNPTGVPGTSPDLAFHTATSFATNTDLQHYAGEASLSLFSHLSLMVPMFIAPGTAIAAGIAFIRALPPPTGKCSAAVAASRSSRSSWPLSSCSSGSRSSAAACRSDRRRGSKGSVASCSSKVRSARTRARRTRCSRACPTGQRRPCSCSCSSRRSREARVRGS